MNCHLLLSPCELVNLQIHPSWWTPSVFMLVYMVGYEARNSLHTGTGKIDPNKFCHLI